MSTVVSPSDHIFAFHGGNEPAVTVSSGETVVIETMDCFSDQMQTSQDTIDELNWDHVNPATGPIYVEGAKPGDVLKVELLSIEVGDQAVMATGEGLGTLGSMMSSGLKRRYAEVKDGKLIFDEKVSLDLDPMVGVIGVAPEGDAISCGTPGFHGGNMDNTMIREGATLYFPVFVEGALFAAGDLHAVMGDGEVGVSGAEIPGTVTARLTVIEGVELTSPVLMDDTHFSTIASALTLDEATEMVVHDMATILLDRIDLEIEDLAMLFSLAADVQVAQIVDPLKTARFVIPREVIEAYGFEWV